MVSSLEGWHLPGRDSFLSSGRFLEFKLLGLFFHAFLELLMIFFKYLENLITLSGDSDHLEIKDVDEFPFLIRRKVRIDINSLNGILNCPNGFLEILKT